MEQIANPIAGCFVQTEVVVEEENSDDDGDDDKQFLGYKEVEDVRKGKSLVSSKKPKLVIGSLVDIETRKPVSFRGHIHLPGQWWRVIALRTKKARDKRHYPSDMHALTYRLRNDDRCIKDNVVHLLLTKIGTDLSSKEENQKSNGIKDNNQSMAQSQEEDEPKMDIRAVYFRGKEMFYNYLRERDQYDDLTISNLEERVTEFYNSFIEKTEEEKVDNKTDDFDEEDPYNTPGKLENHNKTSTVTKKEGYETANYFKELVLETFEFRCIKLAQMYPELVRYLPQLFPYHFFSLVTLDDDRHKDLLSAIENTPGHLAFKQVASKECGTIGVETSYQALERCGLLAKVPQLERDAIMIYEYLKRKTKEEGHTGVKFDAIMDYFGSELGLIEEAHQFLEKHKITKSRMESGYRMVYLMSLWQAEKKIAKGISSLFTLQEAQPWKLEVDWNSEVFKTIKEDPDQFRAAQLIANQPVVAISGKGGCGKTHVVTQVITAARSASPQSTVQAERKDEISDENGGPGLDDSELMEYREPDQQKQPRSVKLLLTAPTGKAANLLGKRANQPSYTLHQVIYSHGNTKEWKHRDVNTLVVDECSLVAVTTFSYLIHLLIRYAQLRRIILLGDVRQLPSIEPGNFLDDTFESLRRLGCGVELRNNHRAESQIIVDNATKISKKIYPQFVTEKFTLLKVPESNPFETGDDVVNDDTEVEVKKVLKLPVLQDDTRSQFISFTRKICDRVNEACCRKYSEHPTRTPNNRRDFRTKDKICCTKNGYVNLYEYDHGIMKSLKKLDSDKSKLNERDDSNLNDTGIGLQQDDTKSDLADDTDMGETGKEKTNSEKRRLCNGEIFFIEDVKIIEESHNKFVEYFYLSERDPDEPDSGFWVDRSQLKKQCKIRHAWARTIHTFQGSETDHIVYIVGKRNRHQNWQHVYTAITRGRKSVFIIGQESVLRQVIKTKETKRTTSLRKQLTELLQKNPDFISSQSVLKQSMLCLSPAPPPRNPHLDMTFGVTGILTALAAEHDGKDSENNANMNTADKADSAVGKMTNSAPREETPCIGKNKVGKNKVLNAKGVDAVEEEIKNRGSSKKTKLKLSKKKMSYHYRELDFTNRSPLHNSLMKKTSEIAESPVHSGNYGDYDNDDSYVIEDYESPDSVTEPRSNESMWSEADESQYVSFLEATMCSINTCSLQVSKYDENCIQHSVVSHIQTDIGHKSKSNIDTPDFTKLKPLFKKNLSASEMEVTDKKSLDENNSANSQWSDAISDEQYLTLNLDLEDIEKMEKDFDAVNKKSKSHIENKLVNSNDSDDVEESQAFKGSRLGFMKVNKSSVKKGILKINDFIDLDESLTDSKANYRNTEPLLKTPEKQSKVKHTSPLLSVPDTPLDMYSRKRRSLEKHEDMLTSPTKLKTEKKDLSLTPLKTSLAELNFK